MKNIRKIFTLLSGIAVLPLLMTLSVPDDANSSSAEFHGSLNCSECHTMVVSDSSSSSASSSNPKLLIDNPNASCRGCHNTQDLALARFASSFHTDASRSCTDCHGIHEDQLRVQEFAFSFSEYEESRELICSSCHSSSEGLQNRFMNVSAGHKGAYELVHSERVNEFSSSASSICLECHTDKPRFSNVTSIANQQAPVIDEHGSHPVGVRVEPGAGIPGARIRMEIDSRIKLFNGKIECQTCHTMIAGNTFREVDFPDRSSLCQSCHELD